MSRNRKTHPKAGLRIGFVREIETGAIRTPRNLLHHFAHHFRRRRLFRYSAASDVANGVLLEELSPIEEDDLVFLLVDDESELRRSIEELLVDPQHAAG